MKKILSAKNQNIFLFLIFVALFIMDMIIPDPLPLIDEALLAIGSIITGMKIIKK